MSNPWHVSHLYQLWVQDHTGMGGEQPYPPPPNVIRLTTRHFFWQNDFTEQTMFRLVYCSGTISLNCKFVWMNVHLVNEKIINNNVANIQIQISTEQSEKKHKLNGSLTNDEWPQLKIDECNQLFSKKIQVCYLTMQVCRFSNSKLVWYCKN